MRNTASARRGEWRPSSFVGTLDSTFLDARDTYGTIHKPCCGPRESRTLTLAQIDPSTNARPENNAATQINELCRESGKIPPRIPFELIRRLSGSRILILRRLNIDSPSNCGYSAGPFRR